MHVVVRIVRIPALLQRKTLIETKNRPLNCLKWRYSTVRSMKNVAMLTENGAFAVFFSPHPVGFDSSRVPTSGNLPSKAKKKCQCPGSARGGGGRGWVQVELTDASGGGAFKMRKNSSAILYTICVYTSRKSPKRGISERNGKAVSQLKHLLNDP